MRKQKSKRLLLMATGMLLLLLGICYFLYTGLRTETRRFGVVKESALVEVPAGDIPENALYITKGRRLYERGGMTLIIPAISVYTQVGESTDPEGLKEMPGMYEFSQLPQEGNYNVSIAGHRDIHDMAFYSLDGVEAGNYLYLLYNGIIYQYLYRDTRIVEPDDWSVIQPQGFSCLTLTTCDPIGTSLYRMILRAELADQRPFDEGYQFVVREPGVT